MYTNMTWILNMRSTTSVTRSQIYLCNAAKILNVLSLVTWLMACEKYYAHCIVCAVCSMLCDVHCALYSCAVGRVLCVVFMCIHTVHCVSLFVRLFACLLLV